MHIWSNFASEKMPDYYRQRGVFGVVWPDCEEANLRVIFAWGAALLTGIVRLGPGIGRYRRVLSDSVKGRGAAGGGKCGKLRPAFRMINSSPK